LAQIHVLTEAVFGLAPVVSTTRSATSHVSAASEPRRFDQRQSDPRIFEQRQSNSQPAYASDSIPANATFSDGSDRGQAPSANEVIEVSREDIEAALKQHHGVIARVAKALGLSRQALYRRMDKFGLDKS